ncbi:MAG: hypothetical protein QOH81_3266 [Sphingomonadales bacterium]|jgi:DNA-binding transcriptional LysR family regulator|nr:hypothetical protein [Sphingomonadales bacterium]
MPNEGGRAAGTRRAGAAGGREAGPASRDGLTLDQFATFVAVVEEGSFSGAARRVGRAQSAITYAVQNLELQTGSALFDRSAYRPSLTPAGRALLPRARRILEGVEDYRRQSRSLLAGCEARLTIAVDVVIPTELLTGALKAFGAAFPMVEVELFVQLMDVTLAALREGRADLGLIVDAPRPDLLEGLERRPCGRLDFVMVAAPEHPLAQAADPIRQEDLRDHTQILLSAGLEASLPRDWFAYAVNRWRVNNLELRHSLVLAGAGWCSMPRHLVGEDLAAGRLVTLSLDQAGVAQPREISTSVAHHRSRPPGPAGRWLIDRLIADSAGSKGA